MKTYRRQTPPILLFFSLFGNRNKQNHTHLNGFDVAHFVNKDWKLGKTPPSIVIFRFNDDNTGSEKAITNLVTGTYVEYPFDWSVEKRDSIKIRYRTLPDITLKIFSVTDSTLVMNDILLNGTAHNSQVTFYNY